MEDRELARQTREAARLRRAVVLFDYIDEVKRKEDAIRRDFLADHIVEQKEKLDRVAKVLETSRRDREFAEERERKQFLIQRRKILYAVATPGARVPQPLEQLHPSHPHFTPSLARRAGSANPSGKFPAATRVPLRDAPISTTHLPENQSTTASVPTSLGRQWQGVSSTATVFDPPPRHHEATALDLLDLDEGTLPSPLPDASASDAPAGSARSRPLSAIQVYRSRAYKSQAVDHRNLRSELSTPHERQIYTPSRRVPRTRGVASRIDSRRASPVRHGSGRGRRRGGINGRNSRRGRDALNNSERDSAIEAVFGEESSYKAFKSKYEKPVNVGTRVESEIHEVLAVERQVPHRLATKRLMFEGAIRNRQRTVTFAQSGGTSGVSVAATPATPGVMLAPPPSRGLEAFAAHFSHTPTDAFIAPPDLDAELAFLPVLDTTADARGANTLPRPASSIGTASPVSMSRRGSAGEARDEILAIAVAQMGTGRRGPSASTIGTRPTRPASTMEGASRPRMQSIAQGGTTLASAMAAVVAAANAAASASAAIPAGVEMDGRDGAGAARQNAEEVHIAVNGANQAALE
ncbi:hypothetical protein HKX48_001207 [Thoreauomyces humboldtii]|nr:hypothetical protein HKX48_001207 [Thoreauomyces humboldtii]